MCRVSLIAAGADGVKPTKETVKKWRQEIAAKKTSIREVNIWCFMSRVRSVTQN